MAPPTIIYSSDAGLGQENDQESATGSDLATGAESWSLTGQPAWYDSSYGFDTEQLLAAVQVVASSDAGSGYGTVVSPHTDTEAATGAEAVVLALSSSDQAIGSEPQAQLGVYAQPPPWLFATSSGGYLLIWCPDSPEERVVRKFDYLDHTVVRYAEMIRLSDSLYWPSDADQAAGDEVSLPTATIVQYAAGTLVTCGVPS